MILENKKSVLYLHSQYTNVFTLTGEMAERSNAAVLKTVDCHRSGGSNPSFSASRNTKGYKTH